MVSLNKRDRQVMYDWLSTHFSMSVWEKGFPQLRFTLCTTNTYIMFCMADFKLISVRQCGKTNYRSTLNIFYNQHVYLSNVMHGWSCTNISKAVSRKVSEVTKCSAWLKVCSCVTCQLRKQLQDERLICIVVAYRDASHSPHLWTVR